MEERHRDPANWLSYDRDNTAARYSPLSQITPDNAKKLVVKWVFQFPQIPGLDEVTHSEVTPLVRDGVMYITVGGNSAYALDGKTGRALWRAVYHRSRPMPRAVNRSRGFAISENRLFMSTSDGSLIALDASSGGKLWKREVADPERSEFIYNAPLVVKDLVISGLGGGDRGKMRGYLDAFRVDTGERVWRRYTVPEPGEPGSETWPDTDVWERGGSAPWLTGSYDPDLDLVFWLTGNPGPRGYYGADRKGDNLFSNCLLAIDPNTGEFKWHFQFTPHDVWDWDAAKNPTLVDAIWRGEPRKLFVLANRNGFFYVLDRVTGEFLLARPYVKQTWAERILPSGRPVFLPNITPTEEGVEVCPDPIGGSNWDAQSYNPKTGLLYVMARDSCSMYYPMGASYVGYEAKHSLKAIDIETGKVKWTIPMAHPNVASRSGTMTTGGGLVFFGFRDGYFMAADAETGDLLWHFNTGGIIHASPMTYAVDGKQYVSVASRYALFVFGLVDGDDGRED